LVKDLLQLFLLCGGVVARGPVNTAYGGEPDSSYLMLGQLGKCACVEKCRDEKEIEAFHYILLFFGAKL
jgi:hypothetical protein